MVVLIKPWNILKEMICSEVDLDWDLTLDNKLPKDRVITLEISNGTFEFEWQPNDDYRHIWRIYEVMIEKVIKW